MASCDHCTKKLKGTYSIRCATCTKWCCQNCSELTTDKIKEIGSKKATWDCQKCVRPRARRSDVFIPSQDTSSSNKSQYTLDDVMNKLDDMQSNYDNLLALYLKQQETNKELELKIANLEQKQLILEKQLSNNNTLKNEVNVIKEQLNVASKQLHITEQDKLECNIIVSGISATVKDKAPEIKKVFEKINAQVTDDDIKNIISLSNNEHGSIIKVECKSLEIKNKIWNQRKSLIDVNLQEISTQNGSIYISHDLTKTNQTLFKKIRNYKKQNDFRFAWYNKGLFFLKKEDDSKPIIIRSENDLAALSKN